MYNIVKPHCKETEVIFFLFYLTIATRATLRYDIVFSGSSYIAQTVHWNCAFRNN
jgi:hypothetical protein